MAILLRDLFIPFVTKAITSFDCNSEATVNDAGQEITKSYLNTDKSLGFNGYFMDGNSEEELQRMLKNIIKQLNQECKTSGARINFGLIYKQLKIIVESEVKSRKCFEELMLMQTGNTAELRNYAKHLFDIYNDEDTAEMILLQAEKIKEINCKQYTGINEQFYKDRNIPEGTIYGYLKD
ncbi:MAG: hypothetical protein EZS28_003759 [Streblomastix strix]|uniref:Uncharacterized protein n=1 Tax=Streblomastix strix TaxID=222440 RepID=A0A5J4X0Q8_9EUKA|nr:MAG: hypothetical protein EZS28_003759 [Streblomastix strix]